MPSGGIVGNIKMPRQGLPNAVVTAWLIKDGKIREIQDDFPEGGRFHLSHLPAGAYQITLSTNYGKLKLSAYTQNVEVRDGSITDVFLRPKRNP
jgi:hypothetical protein